MLFLAQPPCHCRQVGEPDFRMYLDLAPADIGENRQGASITQFRLYTEALFENIIDDVGGDLSRGPGGHADHNGIGPGRRDGGDRHDRGHENRTPHSQYSLHTLAPTLNTATILTQRQIAETIISSALQVSIPAFISAVRKLGEGALGDRYSSSTSSR